MGRKVNFILLLLIVCFCAFTATNYQELSSEIDKGDTAWMLVASAFVLLMTPGLSFFYGGMIDKKNIIKDFLNYIIRGYPKYVTSGFLNFVENLMHSQIQNNNAYIYYSLSRLSSLLST